MGRSFDLVDDKAFEADFFLEKLSQAGPNLFAARCYFSAFAAAARSITFVLQSVMKDVDGFDDWYKGQQSKLIKDKAAKFFVQARNDSQHIGLTPVNSGCFWRDTSGKLRTQYHFGGILGQTTSDAPELDVVSACNSHLTSLIQVIHNCYWKFGFIIDPDQYYTLENLQRLGLTIEDIEEDLGFPRGWTDVDSCTDQQRIDVLRRHIPGTEIDTLFKKYLGKTRFGNTDD